MFGDYGLFGRRAFYRFEQFICLKLICEPAHGRGGPSYFWRPKSNQKRSQREGFFAAQAFAPQIAQNRGCNLFAPLRSLASRASAKSCYALQQHKAIIVLRDFARS